MSETKKRPDMTNEEIFKNEFPVRVYKVSSGWCTENHSHEYMQINYIAKGTCSHIVENVEYRLEAKNIFLIPPYVEHCIKDEQGDFTIICCEFPVELITNDNIFQYENIKSLFKFTYIESFAAILKRTRPCYTPGKICQMRLEVLFENMITEYDQKQQFYEIALKSQVMSLLTLLARDYDDLPNSSKIVKSYSSYIEHSIQFIDANYRSKIYIEDAAKIASMSESYFSYFFKEYTGKTFKEYIAILRVEKSKELLIGTYKTITEIAFETGFNDSAYFNKVFKKIENVTPSKYRKKHMKF